MKGPFDFTPSSNYPYFEDEGRWTVCLIRVSSLFTDVEFEDQQPDAEGIIYCF